MKIVHYVRGTQKELFDKLRQVRLKGTIRGVERPYPYQLARISLQEGMDIENFLFPPQRYVLTPTVNAIVELDKSFSSLDVDIFALEGALYFWLEGMDPEKDKPIPFLPPIVEESCERGEKVVFLVNDGMHRTWTARKLGRPLNIVLVQDIPEQYPYYAYALDGGWKDVEEIAELTDGYKKKDYRDPQNYKALFRDFNEHFPGVQEQRKQTQAHLRE